MKSLITSTTTFGPFSSIEQGEDRWHCDGCAYQFDVIGEATVGEWVDPPPPPPTIAAYTEAVQNLLDTTAQAKHYDNIISCCSYAGAPNAFQAEGQAAIEWRGNVWATCYTIMAEVQAGTIPAPTIPELLAMLPVMVWP